MDLDIRDRLTINQSYADRYEKKKRSEELSQLKDKYGPDAEFSEESSSSEEEDETAQELTPRKTKDFLRVLSLVKHRDSKIYDKNVTFYQDESTSCSRVPDGGENGSRNTREKPIYLKDYERRQLLERGSQAGLSDEEKDVEEKPLLSYIEQQQQLKDRLKQALSEAGSDESGDDFLSLRQKTDQEKEEEEAVYIKWLKGHELQMKDQEMKDMDALRRYWTDPQLDPDEAFLRDYVLNEGWRDKDTGKIPSYEEVVGEEPNISDDEEAIEEQDEFERQFNFRFEEPDSMLIASYPRTVSGSVRLQDERRKQKRKAREERKARERDKKKEELRRLKNLKRQEIQEKLQKLQELTGNSEVGFTAEELEGEFDPDKYDSSMRRVFDKRYYEEEEGAEKPMFSDSEEEEYMENLDGWVAEEEPHCEDPDFNMDADYDPDFVPEVLSRNQRCQKRNSHFSQMVHKQKPLFEPSEKSFEEYFDEYYKLDYEDVVADIPCRFKYRQTIPNDFGLSTEEILVSDNSELNRWASLMKTVQFRSEEEEEKDVSRYRKKAMNFQKKLRVLSTLKELMEKEEKVTNDNNPTNALTAKKRKQTLNDKPTAADSAERGKRRRTADGGGKKRDKELGISQGEAVSSTQGLSSSRLASYGLAMKKKKKKKKKEQNI